ncbi:PxKF domain-containing protein [Cellulomonas cellasea]|uniref:SGNH hydrolase-type esterase domain-containing protein n=1 Tax=Cellulomonas cellasea DSM 20118 TaxID=1408250 RepID=A0A0A0B2M7_9CELL|nr:PxKF domain-containing protein [Cellulomonas cellasea]KGM01065.1 hypothetical protein Q760_04160 [Cellulomonas cellasea DSM 20118]
MAAPSAAEDGIVLRQFTAEVPPCSVSTGIAFDGSALYLSCWDSANLYLVSPEDGTRLDTVPVAGMGGIGALAWDASRGKLWACDSGDQSVHLITFDGSTATSERRFVPQGGCIDGLAYDGGDDSLFTSGDVAYTVYHFSTDGELLDSREVGNSLGGCGSSGIAVGGGDLFLANNGCSAIYRADNIQNSTASLFATYERRIEDLECDDVTFRDEGKAAIWAQDAYDAEIHALELNVGDCGFGGLPPSDDTFVYVALGDSYQSGEGAGNAITDTSDYLASAYENGSNYPLQVGAQEDTFSRDLLAAGSGNTCHRALENYAKLNRDRLEPGAETVLIDETCSGAEIEPGGKPPVVGDVEADEIDSTSQVQQVLDRLDAAGLGPEDVDLVTVGMGGNDAGFGKIVETCLMPAIVERLLEQYPDAPGELRAVVTSLGSCKNLARFGDIDQKIAGLQDKEEWAQGKLLGAFEDARVLQVNYPDILPSGSNRPAWCGGIRDKDVDFARDKIAKIDSSILRAVSATDDERLELVDIQHAFGSGALCAGSPDLQLANGISQANVDKEVERLLDIGGNGDAESRRLIDTLADEYEDYKGCLGNKLNPFDGDCDTGDEWQDVTDAVDALGTYLADNQETLLANVTVPPGTEREAVRFDRSRGLFHPNARGFRVVACEVRQVWFDAEADCVENPNDQPDRINGDSFLWNTPFLFTDPLDVEAHGFAGNAPIRITWHSEPVELGTVVADANGTVRTVLAPPAGATAGVHRFELRGVGADGAELVKEIRVTMPGTPQPGDDYGVYLSGFEPSVGGDGVEEVVDVSYLGMTFEAYPDAQGGILLEVPVPGAGAPDATIRAVSRLTGLEVTAVVVEPSTTVSEWRGPFAAPPALNAIKAGRAVPVEFRVLDGAGAPVDDPTVVDLQVRTISCADPAAAGPAVPADDAGASSLRSLGDGWWKYTWKTSKAWSGSCRSLVVDLGGGGGHALHFSLR